MKRIKPTLALAVIFAVCGLFLASCGGGGGSSATTVNGNPIPPRPDDTVNNSTIKGVDTNNNALRDDVEILVASLSKSSTYSGSAFRIAQIENRLATENIATQEEYVQLVNEQLCLNQKRTQEERDILSLDDIRFAVANTKERSAVSYANSQKYANALAQGVTECN